ncbi:MAG TPA: DUF2252 domain-containing protein [Acidimicrobiia bacterium]|nr:DUF2252 domain-containing protein [Acidimicrobiia bacterium]
MSENGATPIVHLDVEQRTQIGRAARAAVPRSAHAEWTPGPDRADPAALLTSQETTRVPELIPMRHERMLASPFTFYRGAAVIMAADVAGSPNTGLRVQACGDAHLSNFGGFSSPDRALLFDINDFDETNVGPFEWDVKRLAASFEIAGRSRGFTDKETRGLVSRVVRSYREAMGEFAAMTNLDLWYARLDVEKVFNEYRSRATPEEIKRFEKNLAKAQGKGNMKAFAKLTEQVDGEHRIKSDPPVVVSLADLFDAADAAEVRSWLEERIRVYRRSLQPDRRHLLESYRLVDFGRKVVGVGSVGTRCWIALMLGRDDADPLFLQVKEAEASVLEAHAGKSGFANHGQRVVEGQRLLQAASDIMLGWTRTVGLDGVERDYYVRQLWDGKFSADIDSMIPSSLDIYARLCGWTLARGHARSGDRVAIAAYLGSNDAFDRAMVAYSSAYADQNERDYESVKESLDAGAAASSARS